MTETLWLEQAVGHPVSGDLNRLDAEAVTAKIKAFAGVAWVLLNEAHQRKAHKAMGYATWGEYVEAEFDMSRSRSYQLINQARVITEISEAVPTDVDVSTMVDISEREARDLLPVLDEAKAAVAEAVDALPPTATDEDKRSASKAALDATRSKIVPRPTEPTGRQTTTTTTTIDFDPETGEIVEGEPVPPATGSGDGGDVAPGQTREASPGSPSSPAPTQGGTEGYRAAATRARSTVRSNLLTLDPSRVIETADEPDHWRQFSADVRAWLDALDADLAGPRLKAVQ